MKNKELKSGDIIFWQAEPDLIGSIQRISGNPVGHCAILYDVVEDKGTLKGRVVESREKGLIMNVYDIENSNVAVKRMNIEIDYEKMRNIVRNTYMEAVTSGNNSYPWDDLTDAIINAGLEAITFGMWETHRLLADNIMKICSSYVAYCYELEGHKITAECNDIITPTSEFKSDQFTLLQDFKIKY